ncbi:hypothetical protein EVAR_95304_1 [Eumeta japonica]|uniref:Uncharacterized protein n=1 Tax=Eumeta variegata TaxID=151549 RepID=A0A4C1UAI8_EUMVA|nr:hypothetical protein EVAR_95304_1 [Eumeta japonica]
MAEGRLTVKEVFLDFTFRDFQANLDGCNQNIVSMVNKNGALILRQRRDDIADMLKRLLHTIIEKLD